MDARLVAKVAMEFTKPPPAPHLRPSLGVAIETDTHVYYIVHVWYPISRGGYRYVIAIVRKTSASEPLRDSVHRADHGADQEIEIPGPLSNMLARLPGIVRGRVINIQSFRSDGARDMYSAKRSGERSRAVAHRFAHELRRRATIRAHLESQRGTRPALPRNVANRIIRESFK